MIEDNKKSFRYTGPGINPVRGSGEGNPRTTGFFIFVVLVLYIFDLLLNYSGSKFTVSFPDLMTIILKIVTSGAFLFFVALFLIYHRKELEPVAIAIRISLLLVIFFIMLYGTAFGIIHLWVGLTIWWVLLRATSYSESSADLTFIFVALFDIFGASFIGTLPESTITTVLTLFAVLPIWFIIIMFSKNIPKPKGAWFLNIIMLSLIFFNYYSKLPANPLSDETGMDRAGELMERVTGAAKGGKRFFIDIGARIKTTTDEQLRYATGGYYEGKVEKNVAEPLGVYIEDIEKAEREFYEDEKIIVWATVKARTLDEEHPVDIKLGCVADEDEEVRGTDGDIIPAEKREFRIETLEEEDISCTFDEGLEKGSHEIKLTAEFDFTTMAYLKTYFMDKERRRALIRDGVDIFNEYGIKDKDPIAVYTNGPVKIGAETTKSLPLGVDKDAGKTMPRLGITLHNKWLGKITKIKDLQIEVPDSISIVDCDYSFDGPWNSLDEGFVIYKLKEEEKTNEKLVDIENYRSINCRLKIDKPDDLLGNTPISVRYYRIKADYIYKLEEPIMITVLEPKGFKSVLTNCEDECGNKNGCICPDECPIKREIERGENCTAIIQPSY